VSSSTDAASRTWWLRVAGAVALLAVQLAGLWVHRLSAGREAALAAPEPATLLRWRPDVTGTIEFHGDQAFTLSAERGLRTIRLAPDTVVLRGTRRASPSALRPGVAASVWGTRAGPRGIAARAILVWAPEP
jgi:hypothetical protein